MDEIKEVSSLIEKFNMFIKKWCGNNYGYLIDSDENDGEWFRGELRQTEALLAQKDKEIVELRAQIHAKIGGGE